MIDFFKSIVSTDYKERGHALRVLDKLMPVVELARLEDSAKSVQNIDEVVGIKEMLKKIEETSNETDPDTE